MAKRIVFVDRNSEDRRGLTDRRVLNLGFGPRSKDRRRQDYERRLQEERRENWKRITRWRSIEIDDKNKDK